MTIEDFIARVRALSYDEIDTATAAKYVWQSRLAAVGVAERVCQVAGPPNWIDLKTRVVNASIAAHADVAGKHADFHELAVLWGVVECRALGIMARAALTPAQYTLLVSPALSFAPELAELEGVGLTPITPKEAAPVATSTAIEPFTKAKQTAGKMIKDKPVKAAKSEAPAKTRVEAVAREKAAKKATPIKAMTDPKPKARTASEKAPKPTAQGRKVRPVTAAEGDVWKHAIIIEALEFTARHAAIYEAFRTGKMNYAGGAFNYTLDTILKPVLAAAGIEKVGGQDKVALGFRVMAELAATSDPRLVKMARAWEWWKGTVALGALAPVDSPVAKAIESADITTTESATVTATPVMAPKTVTRLPKTTTVTAE